MSKAKLKSKYSFVSVLLALASILLLFAGITFGANGKSLQANADVNVETSREIESSYAFGDAFTIPACSFEKNGETAVGVASLQYPSGAQTGDEIVSLNQSGKYVLRYIANLGGKVYTKEYSFTVKGRLASYENSKTSMKFGVCTQFGSRSTGLMVRIANGDALEFDHVFNMSELTMATKLLEGFVVPNTQGSVDFSKMVFTFTDVEDPSVQLVYHGNFYPDSNAYGLTYFTAAGNGQIHCGLEHVGKLHVGTSQGCIVPHSFMAVDTGLYWGAQAPVPTAPDEKKFCISYDSKSNQAWAGGKIISDLDDSNYYSSMWFGFPSGKAKLTISALNYNDATANICFTSILGVDLSATNYIDDEAPIITVNNEYDEMPMAIVGGTYPVPTATALDRVSGACDVKVSVWHNYGAENAKMVDMKDGRFLASDVGLYAIVYEASDYSGNVSRNVLWVRANLSQYVPKLTVTIDESYSTEVEVGTLQFLPSVTVSGGSGKTQIIYSLTKGKEVCEIEDGAFRLEKAGEWTLTCTAIDYVGNVAVDVYVLNGVASGKLIVNDEPKFPTAYVSGSTYELPILYAYDYSSGEKVGKTCETLVECGGESKTYAAGASFVPTVENDGESVKIKYVCGEETLLEKEIPVLIVFGKERIPGSTERYRDVVNVEKYFYTQNAVAFENKYVLAKVTGLKISAVEATESLGLAFANTQLASDFSLDFLTVPGASKFSQMNVTLTDSADASIAVKASLIKDDGQTLLVVGDTVLTLTIDFDGGEATAYNVGFSDGKFVVNATTSISVNKTTNGAAFNGFPSGKVYFDVELCDAEENAAIFLSKICGINVSNTQDNTGPFISTMENVATNAFKDSIYTVQKVIACDTLCPNTKALLTVVGPNGEFVADINGLELNGVDATVDYQIKLAEYGEYSVSVIATESGGWKYTNNSYLEYVVTVVDGEKPTITFKKSFAKNLKVGDLLVIPTYEVKDNFTASEKLNVVKMIINPKGMPIYLYGEENAVRCEYAGVYQVKIYVYDEMGNLATYETSVTVK